MSLRPLWSGYLRCSLVTVPIRLYAAVDADAAPHAHQLHQLDHGRIGYDKKCRTCGAGVDADQIVSGYEYGPDQHVVLAPEELQQLRLPSARVIDLVHFVPADQVPPALFDTPYYLGPHGPVAAPAYALLAAALAQSGHLGVGKLALREREDLAFLSPYEDGLILYKARFPQRLRAFAEVPHRTTDPIPAEGLPLARRLIEARRTALDQITLRDTYPQALRELIEAKLQGQLPTASEAPTPPVLDLMTALEQSLAQLPVEAVSTEAVSTGVPARTARPRRRPVPKQAA
ncbi:MAG: Ku protein [Gemmatimonadota bacterium]